MNTTGTLPSQGPKASGGEIVSAMVALDNNLISLRNSIDNLAAKIAPTLNTQPQEDKGGSDSAACCPLSDSITENVQRVISMNEFVNYLIDRCEL